MTLTLNTDGLRLDAALAALLPELSRSAVQRLLEDGAVTLDGRPATSSSSTSRKDSSSIRRPAIRTGRSSTR